MACKSLDEQVVRQDAEMQRLEQQFVCVRLVQMKGVDLRIFQFDYDQSWAVFFLNADGTIYGRYGTRGGDKKNAANFISIASLKKSMERALQLHRGYPANKNQLAGKLGPAPRYALPEQIPGLEERGIGFTTPQNCIHCHMVGERMRQVKYREKRLAPADVWIFPRPENIGVTLEVDDGLRIEKLQPGSPVDQAGLKVGDELRTLNGQPLVSQADIQWVLHRSPTNTTFNLTLVRDGRTLTKAVSLSGNWKETDLSWRESSWSFRPGLWTIPLTNDEKTKRNLPSNQPALLVKWVIPRAQFAKQAGLKDGDVIVAVDDQPAPSDESHFMAYVRLKYPPGGQVKLTLLRGPERKDVMMQVE